MKFILASILSVFLLTSASLSAQFNFKVAYELDYFDSAINDAIVESFNKENSFLAASQEMPNLNFLNGISVGLIYKTKTSRFGLSWRSSSRTREAFGEIPGIPDSIPATSFDRSIKYNLSGFQISSEFIVKRLGIGISAGTETFRSKSTIIGTNNDKLISKTRLGSASVFLSYSLYQGERIDVVLRPYFRWYLNDLDQGAIAEFLEVGDTQSSFQGRPYSVGISVVFFNGRQIKN